MNLNWQSEGTVWAPATKTVLTHSLIDGLNPLTLSKVTGGGGWSLSQHTVYQDEGFLLALHMLQ